MKWQYKLICILILFVLSFLVGSNYVSSQELHREGSRLIRLHIVANSDTRSDQLLKHKVRDKIISDLGTIFNRTSSLQEAREILKNNMERIELLAKREIQLAGKDYGVTTQIGIFPFPTKWYGNFALPAGNYEAVKVVLGEGKGANWWCVVFPPLCFVDITNGLAEKADPVPEAKSKIEIKLKSLELLESLKQR